MIFCSGWIRTLVAMATYSSLRLILMGKEEIDIFFCLNGESLNVVFTEKFIEYSSPFHDFCPNRYI